MAIETKVEELLSTIIERLNAIGSNAKRIFELSQAQSVDLTSKFHIDLEGTSYYLTLQQLADKISPSTSQVIQEILIPTQSNQKTFLVPGNPENVLVQKGRTNLIPDSSTIVRDFDYDASTGLITTTKGLIYNIDSSKSEKLYVTGFSNKVGTIQVIEATEEDQTEFYYSGAPASVKVMAGRTNMLEGTDFNRTRYSTNNKVTFTKGKPIGSVVLIIKL